MRPYFTVTTLALLLGCIMSSGCSTTSNAEEATETMEENMPTESDELANIVSVSVSSSFVFSVGISSVETGCDLYANWWEVITPEGILLYRRILAHPHVNEQPFVRSGGPVDIDETTEVYIRAHMHPNGYGGVAYKGSVSTGFSAFELDTDFAAELAKEQPLPTGCAG